VNSHILHGSESLCKLLRYLGEQALDHPGASVKEYQIATEVFGRPADFDPHMDSTVRVQAGRLRIKLAEYYSTEGAEDPIVVDLPKGSYSLSFQQRGAVPVKTHSEPHIQPRSNENDSNTQSSQNWRALAYVLALLLLVAVAAISILLLNRNTTKSS